MTIEAVSDIEAAIGQVYHVTATDAVWEVHPGDEEPLSRVSLCIVLMRNGFTVVGKSAPASPENFDAELGRKLAYKDAVRQLWPLMGFALRDKLAAETYEVVPNLLR